MLTRLQNIFSTDGFMAHGYCYLWNPGLVWIMAASDLLIGLAYLSISWSVYALVRKISIPFHSIFLAFGLFIFACGATHFMEIYTLWHPAYWVAAFIKGITALASVVTAVSLSPLKSKILAFAKAAALSDQRYVELQEQYELLSKNKERFRLLVDAVKDYAIFLLDAQGCIETWNEGAKRLKQYEAGEIIGKSFAIFYPPTDLASGKPAQELVQALAHGRYEDEGWRIRKDGSQFWANIIITPIKDRADKHIGFSKVTRDLTERKNAEEAIKATNASLELRVKERTEQLIESEKQFQTFADSMPQLAWIADADGAIFWYNKGWYDYTGTTFEQMEGWGWQNVHDPKELPRVLQEWTAGIKTGNVVDMQFPLKGADGIFRWFLTRVAPVFNSTGKVVRWLGTNTNIDDHKHLQDELRNALVSRDEFLSIASHELKTPITSLKLQLEMAQRAINPQKEHDPARLTHTIAMSARQALRLEGLVADLLDVSKIRLGKMTFHLEELKLATLIRDVSEQLAEQLKKSKSSIIFDLDETILGYWDRARIEQVVINLISNAIKYASGKPIEISSAKSGLSALLSVKDHGHGIAAQKLSVIFERFERATSSRNISGMGLGLYIAKQIVEGHEGTILVTSTEGIGSTFTVILPMNATHAPLAPKAASHVS